MKSVGLFTCFLDNCGACLQAYALQNSIKDMGYSCEIIKFTEPYGYQRLYVNRYFRLKYLALSSIKSLLKFDFTRRRFIYDDRRIAFDDFRNKNLLFSEKEYTTFSSLIVIPLKYDGYVCGSDQIWNPLFYKHNNPAYFLEAAPSKKKRIAYAPSIGLSKLPDEYSSEFKKLISKFDHLSVRELEGKNIIKNIANIDCRVVLDPTMLYDSDKWDKLAKSVKLKKPFIFCYIFGNQNFSWEFVDYIKNKTGLEVVCMPFFDEDFSRRYKMISKCGPSEFLWLIKNAKLVLTDSFHATVFSIIFETPFYTMLRNSDNEKLNMNSRIFNILSNLGLENRLISEKDAYTKEIDCVVDFTLPKEKLEKLRIESKEYLRNALGSV